MASSSSSTSIIQSCTINSENSKPKSPPCCRTPQTFPFANWWPTKFARKWHFIKTLLAAETEPSAHDKPERLEEIAERLSAVENSFTDWASSGSDVTAELNLWWRFFAACGLTVDLHHKRE